MPNICFGVRMELDVYYKSETRETRGRIENKGVIKFVVSSHHLVIIVNDETRKESGPLLREQKNT